MFRTDTEAKVSAAIEACVRRYSKLSIEIQKPQNIILTKEYSDLQGATWMQSTGAATAVPESGPRGAHETVLEKMATPPSRCSVRVFYATDRHSLGPTFGKERNPDGTIALAGVYCGFGRQISKSSFLCSLSRPVGITHGG
jgi:hypothetical protein